ncbi:hypothetical protein VJY32_09780 [Ignavibacteria bacterium 4148-Me]
MDDEESNHSFLFLRDSSFRFTPFRMTVLFFFVEILRPPAADLV